MVEVSIANKEQHALQIRELFLEHLQWANRKVKEEFGIDLDATAMLETDMNDVDKFMPPKGRLLFAYRDNALAGIACLKSLTPEIGEIKRMYVRPRNRRQGVGAALLNRLMEEAAQIGYERLWLDTAPFMVEAQNLYRRAGFTEIDAYEGNEVPKKAQGRWVFMENRLPKRRPT